MIDTLVLVKKDCLENRLSKMHSIMGNQMSLFNSGYINKHGVAVLSTWPHSSLNVYSVYDYVTSTVAKSITEKLREIDNHDEFQDFKKLNFSIVTPACVCSYRDSKHVTCESGFMVLDVDDITKEQVPIVRDVFINDTRVVSALVFTSPSGLGVKAFVIRDNSRGDKFKDEFNWLYRYFLFEYGIILDRSGSDICRACYLPYDPTCYIHPEFIITNTEKYA